jgi:hypothetical protein
MKNITINQNGDQSQGSNASVAIQGLAKVVVKAEINYVRNQASLPFSTVWVVTNTTGTSCQTVIQCNLGYNGSHPITRQNQPGVCAQFSQEKPKWQNEPSNSTMAITIKAKFVAPTAGEQTAKIVSLAPVTKDSKGATVNDLVITVELDNSKDAAGAPFRLQKVYDLNLKGVGIFKKDVRGITGKALSDAELASFDENVLVGKTVKVNVPKITALPKDGHARFGTFVESAQTATA